jgi:hypothetical protein
MHTVSKITELPRNRALLAIAGYIALTVIVTLLSSAFLPSSSASSFGIKILFALCGPVLALGTHMSVFLWIPLSIPLVGLLVIGAIYTNTRWLTAAMFVISWLAIGWYLKDLF